MKSDEDEEFSDSSGIFDQELTLAEMAGDYEFADPDDYEVMQSRLLDYDEPDLEN